MLERILKSCMYLLAFLMPLFFLPFTADILEFNKTYLLFFLVWFSALVCLFKMIIQDKEIRVRYSKYELLIAAFVLVALFSTIFSVDKYSSLLGTYGRSSYNFIILLTFIALYFLITHNIRLSKEPAFGKPTAGKSISTEARAGEPASAKASAGEESDNKKYPFTISGIVKAVLSSKSYSFLFEN